MAFKEPFSTGYKVGDLLYGLGPKRSNYMGVDAFKDLSEHNKKRTEPHAVIDYYLTQKDADAGMDFTYEIKPSTMKNRDIETIKEPYHKSFLKHMTLSEHDEKYHDIPTAPIDYEKDAYCGMSGMSETIYTHLGRKCKMGLSWICTSNDKEVKDCCVHFILDGLNMDQIINKGTEYGKSITARELRWVYRNRNDDRVAKKVQFWLNDRQVVPPWVSGSPIWESGSTLHEIEGDKNHPQNKKNIEAWAGYGEKVEQKKERRRQEKELRRQLEEAMNTVDEPNASDESFEMIDNEDEPNANYEPNAIDGPWVVVSRSTR
ncbi:T3SS effector EspK [Xenorhabdus mauleonii]|uniref:T3SS effector EspK n=1 Tax=Xenorhabdus mauleonii TaxID=351675 RepID=A0A1I3HP72_9GAMM|nr:hypothetical protein [Xenorhabdus mauleonii]PHM40328.1 T3SS effector EspK [Xenorhabdus mauleonii]SFI37377.1 hypothetical protein SAMN05421680_1019 [Xenorhabdus mauleonii]